MFFFNAGIMSSFKNCLTSFLSFEIKKKKKFKKNIWTLFKNGLGVYINSGFGGHKKMKIWKNK